MKFLNNLDLQQNEIQNFRVQNLAAAPENPVVGQHYFNTTTNTEYVYNGTKWVDALSQGDYVFKDGLTEDESRNVTLDIATASAIGGVKIGSNVDVATDGTISVKSGNKSQAGLLGLATDAEAAAKTEDTKAITTKQAEALIQADIAKKIELTDISATGPITYDNTTGVIAAEFDSAATASSDKLLKSGVIKTELDKKVDANAAITGATKTKITYDAKGLVTAGADLEQADIPSLNLTKISDVTASAAEVNILDGATVTTAELNVLDGIEASTTELNYVKGVTSAVQTQIDSKIAKADIADNLTTDDATKVLSAKQGKALKEICDSLSAVGRFLSVWDATTGKPETDPEVTPYTYHTGDYFIVGKIAAEGAKNYKPTGTSYNKEASTVEETETVGINDVYYFDGTAWKLMINSGRTVTFASIAGKATDNTDLAAELNKKLDANTAITAGTHTKITYDADGLVTAGADLEQADIPALNLTKISDVTASAAEVNVLKGITASTDELNVLDGITATTAELNFVDGVTSNVQTQLDSKVAKNEAITGATHTKITYDSKGLVTGGADLAEADIPELHLAKVTDVTATAAEVNVLDGITASTDELNILDGVTATATEINVLDGIEASTAELNILKGVTADKDEINILDGIQASTTELNYVKGVTSGIQGQIDSKVAKNADITAATKCKITYDAKGLVTGGADLEASDIPDISATYLTTSLKGAANGVAELDANGLVPAAQLPSYVDDVIDLVTVAATAPATCVAGEKYYNTTDKKIHTATNGNVWDAGQEPETGKIYVALDTNMAYRWSGTALVQIGADKLLGYNGQIKGDASTTSFTVNHNLGTRNVVFEIYEAASPYEKVYVQVLHTSTTALTVVFGSAPAVGTDYNITVIAIG